MLQHTNTNTPTFIQKGVCQAFNIDSGFIHDYNLELQKSANLIFDTFASSSLIHTVKSLGGLFGFINISSTGLSSDQFCSRLISDYNVATTPGIAFGRNWDDHVRVSMAGGYDEVYGGIDRIRKFIDTL